MSVHLCCSSSRVIQKFHQLKCEVEHTNCSQDLKLALYDLHLDCSKIDLIKIRNRAKFYEISGMDFRANSYGFDSENPVTSYVTWLNEA